MYIVCLSSPKCSLINEILVNFSTFWRIHELVSLLSTRRNVLKDLVAKKLSHVWSMNDKTALIIIWVSGQTLSQFRSFKIRCWPTQDLPISWWQGSKIVKGAVGESVVSKCVHMFIISELHMLWLIRDLSVEWWQLINDLPGLPKQRRWHHVDSLMVVRPFFAIQA